MHAPLTSEDVPSLRVRRNVFIDHLLAVSREGREDPERERTGNLQREGERPAECRMFDPQLNMSVQSNKPKKKRERLEASTAGEAIEMMLEKKKISSKINYDVLRHLNSRTGSGGASSPSGASSEDGAVAGRRRLPRRRKKSAGAHGELFTSADVIGKR